MKDIPEDKPSLKELIDSVISLLNHEKNYLIDFTKDIHAADFAEIVKNLEENKRTQLLKKLGNNFPL